MEPNAVPGLREQTMETLQDRAHPNRRALADRFGENVRVMGIAEALYAKRADYDGGAAIIVATLQAFRVEETEGRKVYDANGELMDHFTGISDIFRANLESRLLFEVPLRVMSSSSPKTCAIVVDLRSVP